MIRRSFCCQIIVSNVNVKSFCIYFFEDWFNCSGMDWCGSPRKWKEMCVRSILDYSMYRTLMSLYFWKYVSIGAQKMNDLEILLKVVSIWKIFISWSSKRCLAMADPKETSPHQDKIFFNIMGVFFRKYKFYRWRVILGSRNPGSTPPSYVVI